MILNRLHLLAYRGGKVCFPLASLLLLCWLAAPASAATAATADQQIRQAVQQQAQRLVADYARQQHWSDYQMELQLFMPAEAASYPACDQALQVSAPDSGRLNLNRLRMEVRCSSPQRWALVVTARPDILLPILVAKRDLPRGHQLEAADITLKKQSISALRGSYITEPQRATGLTLKRRLSASQPITQNLLDAPVVVERGQRVVMVAQQQGVEVQSTGIAMKKGRQGETIKVKNERSEREVSAVVTGPGVVHTLGAGNE